MINIKTKLLFRKINKQIAIFMSAVFIVTLAVLFFVAVKTVYRDFKLAAENYFDKNVLDDLVLFGIFNNDDIEMLKDIKGVDKAQAKHRFQGKIEDIDAIIYGTDNSENKINEPYIYEGKSELKTNEAAVNKNFADANNLKLGDTVELIFNDKTNSFIIAALVSYPNYVFLFKDGASTASEAKDFAVIEISEDHFNYIPYNSIYIKYTEDANKRNIENLIRTKLKQKIFFFTDREQSVNYVNYEQTLLQIDSFSYICPSILLLMAILLLYIIQRRNVAVERKQIGIMKAIGLTDFSIMFMYIKYSFLVSFFGILLAFIASKLLLPPIFKALGNIFDMPNFTYNIYIDLWIISAFIILFVCIFSNLLAAVSILKLNPAQSMRGDPPKSSGKILIEKLKIWNKLSFNTRYAVKNASRSKTRYLASLWGMFAAISMTIFAQGFNNSFDYFLYTLYEKFALYDVKAAINPTKWEDNSDILTNSGIKYYDKAAVYQSRLYSAFKDNAESFYVPTLIYKDGFSSIDIPNNNQKEDSVMIPKYLAEKLNVKENDYIGIELYTLGNSISRRVKVSKFVNQQGMFYIYMDKDFAENTFDIEDVYNNIFITAKDDVTEDDIKNILDDSKEVSYYSFRNDEYEAYKNQIATIYLLVQILIFIAFLLGATSLYGVGVITLATRRYEFTLLKVMGYTTKEIMIASLKETITQVIIAIPLGIAAGYGILYLVKKPFSSKLFSFVPYVYESSYILAMILLVAVITFVSIISMHYINKLDMVEGLKDREE
ncbi:ABC transporter permease [uncultured Brachyspira sp.]|uniref:ABC transporter permease n=1 Tax=uncultured Brachyspira sp. TaxID=221953 RepID=UPI0025E0288B|nr:ABC transporter permease [uncultured Brachyspira sp.]